MGFFANIGFPGLLVVLIGIYVIFDLAKMSRQLLTNDRFDAVATLLGLISALYFTSFWPFVIAFIIILGNGTIGIFKRRKVQKQEVETARYRAYLIAKAEQGPEEQTISIAEEFLEGWGISQDEEEGVRLLLRIAETGSMKAQQKIVRLHANQRGKPENYADAVRRFRHLAVDWEAEDLENLARDFEYGWGVPKMDVEASRWYRLARERFRERAEDGDADAANELGSLLYFERGGAKDDAEALKWSLVAAKQADADAQERVGAIYCRSETVPRDYPEAVYWLRRASEKGQRLSKIDLILLHDSGRANPESYAQDVDLYRQELELALQNGARDPEWSFLVSGYERGRFGVPDHDKAMYWLRLASNAGCAQASIWLGDKYLKGRGIHKDVREALRLYRIAAAQGSSKASEKIASLEAEVRNEGAAA